MNFLTKMNREPLTFISFDRRVDVYHGYTDTAMKMYKVLVYLRNYYEGSLVTESKELKLYDKGKSLLAVVRYNSADTGLMKLVLDTFESPDTPE